MAFKSIASQDIYSRLLHKAGLFFLRRRGFWSRAEEYEGGFRCVALFGVRFFVQQPYLRHSCDLSRKAGKQETYHVNLLRLNTSTKNATCITINSYCQTTQISIHLCK